MQGSTTREAIKKHRRHRCKQCGAPATYRGTDGRQKARRDHPLCAGCFATAADLGRLNWSLFLRGVDPLDDQEVAAILG